MYYGSGTDITCAWWASGQPADAAKAVSGKWM